MSHLEKAYFRGERQCGAKFHLSRIINAMKILKKLDHVLANFVVSFKDCTFKESDDDFSFNFQH